MTIEQQFLEMYEMMLDNQVSTNDGYLEKKNAKKCTLIAIESMIDMLKYYGTDIGKYTLLDLCNAKEKIKNLPA
jgi:hypothetical protein